MSAQNFELCMLAALILGAFARGSAGFVYSSLKSRMNRPEMYKIGDGNVNVGQDILPLLLWMKSSPGVTEVKVNRPPALDKLFPNDLSIGFVSSTDHVKELTKMIRVIENYLRLDIGWVETRWENEQQVNVLHFYNRDTMKLFIERGPATNMKPAVKT